MRSPSLAAALAALSLGLAACGGLQRPLGLSSVDHAARDACREPIQARSCADRADAEACWQELAAEYEALPDDGARKRFLVAKGCPSPTVETWLPDPR